MLAATTVVEPLTRGTAPGHHGGPVGMLLGFLVRAVLGVACTVVLTVSLLYAFQDSLLYHPSPHNLPKLPTDNPPGMRRPDEHKYKTRRGELRTIAFEEHFLRTPDGESIHCWLLVHKSDDAAVDTTSEGTEPPPTLIFFHGNAGNMGFRLANAAELFRLGVNVVLMDYRGYGFSSGVPTENGLHIDADVVLDFVLAHPELARDKIAVFGRSLGGAVALALASRRPAEIKGVIVENTFTSISDMIDVVLPLMSPLKKYLVRIKWDSLSLMPGMVTPALFISGDADELVPPPQVKRLYDECGARLKHFKSILGGTHNDTCSRGGEAYFEAIQEFLAVALKYEDFCVVSAADVVDGEGSHGLPTMTASFTVKA